MNRASPIRSALPFDRHAARPGWVYLVGAGPGDPRLITLRGAELLASATLVLFSEPVAPELLALVRPDGEARSIGRRGAPLPDAAVHHEAVAQTLVQAARSGASAVRLHGGDPYLFSRGVALAHTLAQEAIPFEVVPGVTSLQAAASHAGAPPTDASLADRLTVVRYQGPTGAPLDFTSLRHVAGTLCVLGAERNLAAVGRGLTEEAAIDPTTPAMVVCSASEPTQRTVRATLGELAAAAEWAAPSGRALLLVGPTTELSHALGWFERLPLHGKRVLVPRPAHQAAHTVALLRARGAAAQPVPLIEIVPPADLEPARRAVAELAGYDLVVFTSANGVTALWHEIEQAGRDARAFGGARIAAIGPGTAEALSPLGLRPDIVPARHVAEQLADAIIAGLGGDPVGRRVLLARAERAREVLPQTLRDAGCRVDVVTVYRTRPAAETRIAELRRAFAHRSVDAVLLTSSSMVEQLHGALGDERAELLREVKLCSIGPVTTATARRLRLPIAVTADVHTIPGLIDALEDLYR